MLMAQRSCGSQGMKEARERAHRLLRLTRDCGPQQQPGRVESTSAPSAVAAAAVAAAHTPPAAAGVGGRGGLPITQRPQATAGGPMAAPGARRRLGRLSSGTVDPYESAPLTPLSDRPFQALASIAQRAHAALAERIGAPPRNVSLPQR